MFVQGPAINKWSDRDKAGVHLGAISPVTLTYPWDNSFAMASRFFPSRRTGLALAAGCILFSALAAAHSVPGDLSVAQIEEQLQV